MTRREKLLAGIDLARMQGLEIGPLDRPLVEKGDGRRIKYQDFSTAEELRERFKDGNNAIPANIVELDYVVREGSLLAAISERFDYVIASHVFEHVPNPVRWLREMSELLNPGGVLSLAIPDRRFCFDVLRPATSIGEMLEAYFSHRTKPSFKNVFDQRYYRRPIDAANVAKLWGGMDPWTLKRKRTDSMPMLQRALNNMEAGVYDDCHSNLLTAEEFRRFIVALKEFDLIPALDLVSLIECEPNDLEFFVQMRKAP